MIIFWDDFERNSWYQRFLMGEKGILDLTETYFFDKTDTVIGGSRKSWLKWPESIESRWVGRISDEKQQTFANIYLYKALAFCISCNWPKGTKKWENLCTRSYFASVLIDHGFVVVQPNFGSWGNATRRPSQAGSPWQKMAPSKQNL